MRNLCLLVLTLTFNVVFATSGYVEIEDLNTLKIKTPSLQQQQTKKIRLANGLPVYIVSDPGADESAACMLFNVGSWHDPKEYNGCAHFTEHLSFLGSEKYPNEDGLMKKVKERGGVVNAYTASENTVYMFSINHADFTSTLDEFAHMFIDPLFNENGIERELNAVNQEFAMNMESDGSRLFYVIKEVSDKTHPFSGFNCGNKETLQGIPREEVIKFQNAYYGTNNALLVIYTSVPLEEIVPYVAKTFADMPKARVCPEPIAKPILAKENLGKTIYMQPSKDAKSLSLLWDLPIDYMGDFHFQTAGLVAYALNGKGPSSLYASLKNDGLIDSIYFGSIPLGKKAGLFVCDIELTNHGIQNTQVIIERCFEAIQSLKASGVPPYLFNEMKTMSKINYEFQSRGNAFSSVSTIAEQLKIEPMETYPMRTQIPTAYNAERVSDLLSNLAPNKCITFVVADKNYTQIAPENYEKWMKIPYTIQNASETRLANLQAINNTHNITIAKPNQFLPQSLTLLPLPETPSSTPNPLTISKKGKLFYKQDTNFRIPCLATYIHVKSPLLTLTAKSTALAALFTESLNNALIEENSKAAVAGLYVSGSMNASQLSLQVNGYTDKAKTLLRELTSKARTLETSEKQFTLYKEMLVHSYEQQLKAQPYAVAHGAVTSLLMGKQASPEAARDELLSTTYEEYRAFESNVLNETYVEMMACGNLTEEDAYSMWNIVHDELQSGVFPEKLHITPSILTLEENNGPYKYEVDTTMMGNVAYLHIQCGKATPKSWAAHTLFGRIMSTDFFDTLRTKQQTGYICNAASDDIESQLIYRFLVQSTTHDANELLSRYELFLEGYTKQFETLIPESRFEEAKQSLLVQLNQPYTNLYEEASSETMYAFHLEGGFDRKPQRIAAVEALTYEAFKTQAIRNISRSNTRRIAYLLNGSGSPELMEYKKLPKENLETIGTFTSWKTK